MQGKIFLMLLIFSVCLVQSSAVEQKVLIVYPLQAAGIDSGITAAADAALEQGLLKTGLFRVINTEDLELLLNAQGILLSGMFDETKLLSVGRMLPAELMARGEIKTVGDAFFIQVKILDLASGTIQAAESENKIKAGDLADTIRKLVFRLTGQTSAPYHVEGTPGYISLTVTADYKEAAVYLDGKVYGSTPLLIDNIPAGTYYLEIKKESLYYSESVIADRNMTVYGSLQQRFGSLVIISRPGDAAVTIGDINYGKNQFIDKIPAWNQTVILKKPGFYWKGNVPVIAGKTVKIDVALNPTSTVLVQAMQNTASSFYGNDISYEFQGRWEIKDLPPGSYVLESVRAGYQPYRKIIEVGINERIELFPEMLLTTEAQAARQQLTEEQESIVLELKSIMLPEIYLEKPVPELDLISIKNTFFSFIPMLDIFILFDDPLLQQWEKKQFQAVSTIQFCAGFMFQLGVAALLLFDDDDVIRTASVITAIAAGGTSIGLGIYAGIEWSNWTRNYKTMKSRYDNLQERFKEISDTSLTYQ